MALFYFLSEIRDLSPQISRRGPNDDEKYCFADFLKPICITDYEFFLQILPSLTFDL